MLYESLGQPLIIISILAIGLACGMIFDIGKFINYMFNQNKVTKQIILCLCTIISAILLFVVNLQINYGRFRVYIILLFSLSFIIERFTIGKLWTKLLEKCYNKLTKLKAWINAKLNGRKKETEP